MTDDIFTHIISPLNKKKVLCRNAEWKRAVELVDHRAATCGHCREVADRIIIHTGSEHSP